MADAQVTESQARHRLTPALRHEARQASVLVRDLAPRCALCEVRTFVDLFTSEQLVEMCGLEAIAQMMRMNSEALRAVTESHPRQPPRSQISKS